MPPPGPQEQQPTPAPLTVLVGNVPNPAGPSWVVLRVASVTGVAVFFLDPDTAAELSRQLAEESNVARTGLTIANGHGPTITGG